MVTFTKFGSCVTSDIFNFMNIQCHLVKGKESALLKMN